MKQSVSLITLGVSDYQQASAFYAALGWEPSLGIDETVFFQANGVVLVLWARQKLAADSGIADEGARRVDRQAPWGHTPAAEVCRRTSGWRPCRGRRRDTRRRSGRGPCSQ